MKAKRILVSALSVLVVGMGMLGLTACNEKQEETPSYDVTVNLPGSEIQNCVHDYSVVYAEEAPDCRYGKEGYKTMGCSKCGESITVSTGYGHDYGEAKCDEPARCYICGEDKDMRLAEHTWVEGNCEEPTICSVCGETDWNSNYPSRHYIIPATCTEDEHCVNCNYVVKGSAWGHDMVYMFNEKSIYNYDNDNTTNVVDGFINYYDNGQYATLVDSSSDIIERTCSTNGMKQFKICRNCVAEVDEYDMTQDEMLAWGNMNLLERFEYIVMNSYTEGFEIIPASHTMVNYFGTPKDVDAGYACVVATPNSNGEYIQATCVTNGLMNFMVCIDCFHNYGWRDATTYYEIQEMVTPFEYNGWRAEVYAEGFEEATTAALGHNYINPTTGVNTYSAGLAPTCASDGYTESYTCFTAGCPIGTKVSTVLTRDAHDGEVAGMFDITKVENVNTKLAKCGKANYCGDCKTYWGTPVACVTAPISKNVSCTEAGYTGTICVDCGTINYSSYIPATGHNFGHNKVSAQPATCTTAEIKEHYLCDNGCGAKAFGTEIKDAQGYVTDMRYTITTSVDGAQRLGHRIVKYYGSQTVVATNGAAFCSALVNDIKVYLNNTANNATSCTAYAGLADYSCSRNCGWYASVNMHDATIDGAWYVDELGYPTPHPSAYNYNNKVISEFEYYTLSIEEQAKATVCVFKLPNTKVATCVADGTCGICNEVINVATGHDFDYTRSTDNKNYFAMKHATCTTNGVYEYFACTNANCAVISYVTSTGAYSSVAKDANGNDVELMKGNAATYLAIKAHGHNLYVVDAKAPTCREIGWKEYKTCIECAYRENYIEIAKVPHDSFAMGSCATEVICNKSYFVDINDNGKYDIGEIWYGCGTTIDNTNHQPDNHYWNPVEGECDCCKVVCVHPAYVNNKCTVCGKYE